MIPVRLSVVIADDEPITRMDLREILQESGYEVVAEAGDGFDALESCKLHHPDVVLMDIKMPLLDGLSAAKLILQEELAGVVILLTAYGEMKFVEEAKEIGVSGYIVKPIDEKSLIPSIEVLVARSREMKKLRQDIKNVSERLENRIIIEKAKGKVMQEEDKTENEAYEYIKELSMHKGMSMKQISELLLQKRSV